MYRIPGCYRRWASLNFETRTIMIMITRGWALDRVYNSRRPLDRLTLTLTFDLIFIGGRGIVMDYPCAKFSDCTFSRFGFIVRTIRQNYRRRYRFTPATTVGMSK